MHPPDTVMSRMYNQTGNLYSGIWDCLSKTVRTEGLLAVYKGYFAHLARILPHTVCTHPPIPPPRLGFVDYTNGKFIDPDPHLCRANE